MPNLYKVQQISDIIHDTIMYSGLEGEIISTPIFNRLHRISQSSLVFLTYPSNKVKRFEHSIGTMYLSGEIFYHSFCNTHNETAELFIKSIDEEIKKWRSKKNHTDFALELKNIKIETILSSDTSYPNSSFYNNYLPPCIEKGSIFSYLVAFQSIRIAALLHDVGHLPYSHILEKSLKELFNIINEDNEEIDVNIKNEFVSTMKPFVDGNDEIHEEFGKLLVNNIEQCIIENLTVPQKSDETYFFILLSFYFAKQILSSNFTDNTIFSDMHLIISGVVDADRLDYCSRDIYCSALENNIFKYKRFLNGYTLINRCIESKKTPHFFFAPAAKNLPMIEELLRRRYRVFSDINYHHSVHKHEIILEKVICELGFQELKTMDNISKLPDVLPLEISSIWKLVNEMKTNQNWLEYQLIQLDDSWLDTLLKHKFFENYKENYASIIKNGHEIMWNQFDELISSKKHYFSVIKRANDFQLLDETFYSLFFKNTRSAEVFNDLFDKYEDKTYADFLKDNHMFFINYCIKNIFKEKNIEEVKNFFYTVVEKQCNTNCHDLNIINCIIRSCRFSSGLNTIKSPVFLVTGDNKEIMLEQLSNQRNYFLNEEALTPPFHIYILTESGSDGIHLSIDKEKTNDLIAESLISSFFILNST